MTVTLKRTGSRAERVTVQDPEAAARVVTEWQDANDIGASDLDRGHGLIHDGSRVVARVSYNGRVWPVEVSP